MKPRKPNAAAAIRKLRPRIEREMQEGTPKNAIRVRLIKEGAIAKISGAHFNNIVSEFALEDVKMHETGSPVIAARPVAGAGQVSSAPAPMSPPQSSETTPSPKRHFDTASDDNRFTSEMIGGAK